MEADEQNKGSRPTSEMSTMSSSSVHTTTMLNFIDKMQPSGEKVSTCARMCHGNPLTTAGKRKQMAKITILVLIPIAALGGVTINAMTRVSQQNDLKSSIRHSMHFVMDTGLAIHSLQRERDMTTLFCSSGSSETRMVMTDRYPETDRALLRLSNWPSDLQTGQKIFESRETLMQELRRHRRELNPSKTSMYREISYYTALIHVLTDWVYASIQKSRDGSLWRKMVAYAMLVISKDSMGVERTLGAIYFQRGAARSQQVYQLYLQKHFIAQGNKHAAGLYSDAVNRNVKEALSKYSYNVEGVLHHMRTEILYKNSSSVLLQKSTQWFDNMTLMMDALLIAQQKIAKSVIQDLLSSANEDLAELAMTITLLTLTIIVCPFIVVTIQAVMSDVQSYALTLATQASHLSKERQRTNELLYQMLPRTVAEQLKRHKTISAESFDQATIFFSDLAGFSGLVAVSAPIHIVDMLNAVYNCFDTRINCYEVYKVETIGDSYMVASGVPVRIGQRHADEICRMALDLMHHTGHIEILHRTGHRLQLRAGMHSGPVVAGVVGSKMPRYCLFGDTVNTASRMETNSKAGCVQMTEATHNYILNEPDYVLHERGVIQVKGKNLMKTYWLLKKTGFEETLPCMPDCQHAIGQAQIGSPPPPLPASPPGQQEVSHAMPAVEVASGGRSAAACESPSSDTSSEMSLGAEITTVKEAGSGCASPSCPQQQQQQQQ